MTPPPQPQIDARDRVKLADFGLARQLEESLDVGDERGHPASFRLGAIRSNLGPLEFRCLASLTKLSRWNASTCLRGSKPNGPSESPVALAGTRGYMPPEMLEQSRCETNALMRFGDCE